MSTIEEITPEMKGSTIFLRGTQNLATRCGVTPLKEAVIIKVNPKSVLLKINQEDEKITKYGKCIPSCNAGYKMYSTREYAHLVLAADKMKFKIMDTLSGHGGEIPDPVNVMNAAKALGLLD